MYFFQMKAFLKKNVFHSKKFYFIEMLIFSKLFILHLSRRIIRRESAALGAAIGKSQAVIGWKTIDDRASFVYNL